MVVITTSEDCLECVHGTVVKNSKSDIRIVCDARDKEYFYGQRLVCDDKEMKIVREEV